MPRAQSSVIGGARARTGGAGLRRRRLPGVDAPFAIRRAVESCDARRRGDARPAASRADAARAARARSAAPHAAPDARGLARGIGQAVRAEATLATIAQVLTTWAGAHVIGAGFMIEAVLLADGLTPSSSAAMEAAEKLDEALELIRRRATSGELDEAAVLLAEASDCSGFRRSSQRSGAGQTASPARTER